MDMCYDGALVLPSSYAIMEQEEMTYFDGGTAKHLKIMLLGCGIRNTLSSSTYMCRL